MVYISPNKLMVDALRAAHQGVLDCGEQDLSVKELGLLNEQWTQSYVGEGISRSLRETYGTENSRPFVTYETSVHWLDYFFNQPPTSGPKPRQLSDKHRFDLTVWTKQGKPLGLIEIKNEPLMSGYSQSRDPAKLAGALKRWDQLKWGMFVFCCRNGTKKQGDQMVDHLKAKAIRTFAIVEKNHSKIFELSLKTTLNLLEDGGQCIWAGILMRRREA